MLAIFNFDNVFWLQNIFTVYHAIEVILLNCRTPRVFSSNICQLS